MSGKDDFAASPKACPAAGATGPLGVAMVGCGTVGTGVFQILQSKAADLLTQRCGRPVSLRRVVVRDPKRQRPVDLAEVTVSNDFGGVLGDPDIDVIIEVMGGIDPAREWISAALRAGKDVITANKALLYAHGEELFQIARSTGRTICFEAAVAGGIPVIAAINQSLTANRITSIEAILNGTSNFILSRMLDRGESYDKVLAEAQQLGYAEADPAMDVDGTDAAQKLSILAQLAFGTRLQLSEFVRQGIEDIELLDLEAARALGYRVKLLAKARVAGDRLEASVQPTLVRAERSVAQTSGADNIIAIVGDAVGTIRLSGAGAGQMATASAVVSDLVDYATGRAALTFQSLLRQDARRPIPLQPMQSLSRRYYLRFNVADEPHVLADVADILGRHQISISSVHQDETPENADNVSGVARLVIMTHRTTEGSLSQADAEIRGLSSMRGASIRMPVAD
jgi:homoserine dehydrogenase